MEVMLRYGVECSNYFYSRSKPLDRQDDGFAAARFTDWTSDALML